MLKWHLKCDIACWDRELSPHDLSLKTPTAHSSQTAGEGRVVSSRRLNGRDMRQPVRVTDKQSWSLGATSREKHCLGADNKVLTQLVIAPRPMADPLETSVLSLEGATRPAESNM